MRILMFGWEFPPYISGGLGTACHGIVKGLVELGQELIFVLPQVMSPAALPHVKILSAGDFSDVKAQAAEVHDEDKWLCSFKLRAVDSALRPYQSEKQYQALLTDITKESRGYLPNNDDTAGKYGSNLGAEVVRFGEAAESIARSEAFDLIHGHDWTSVLACVNAQRISGKPYIYHAHALEFDRSGENINQDIFNLEKYGLEKAEHVIAVSHYTKDGIIKRYGLDPAKITVVHNAVSRRESPLRAIFPQAQDEKQILFLGRITYQKGPEYFIEAAARVLQHMPEVYFVMAGAGDLLPQMIEKVAEKKMGARFHFTGFLSPEEVEKIYARSDLYVMPSVSEPFGISPLEAMLYDVPVIISKQSGVSEILTHALKVDFWDIEALADKMIALLRHPSLADELTVAARAELQEIKWEYAAANILAVYRQVLVG